MHKIGWWLSEQELKSRGFTCRTSPDIFRRFEDAVSEYEDADADGTLKRFAIGDWEDFTKEDYVRDKLNAGLNKVMERLKQQNIDISDIDVTEFTKYLSYETPAQHLVLENHDGFFEFISLNKFDDNGVLRDKIRVSANFVPKKAY
ncbi:hypothetical protein IJT93_02885 [bacterium]|nr:hypothetical protein [bacterium]